MQKNHQGLYADRWRPGNFRLPGRIQRIRRSYCSLEETAGGRLGTPGLFHTGKVSFRIWSDKDITVVGSHLELIYGDKKMRGLSNALCPGNLQIKGVPSAIRGGSCFSFRCRWISCCLFEKLERIVFGSELVRIAGGFPPVVYLSWSAPSQIHFQRAWGFPRA